jgi:hypothetical protein
MSLKRQPLQIFEIDVDQCTLTYGTGACTAVLGTDGVRKCFNTAATCQDRTNYDKGTLTLRFARNQNGIPKGQGVLPFLKSISTRSAEISLGSPDENLGSLGKRAKITVNLTDATDSDWLTDPYQQERISGAAQSDGIGYNPADYGTFFRKLRTRWQYFQGRKARVRNGYVGDDISSMESREYVITGWVDDINGNVTFTLKDKIDLTDDRKALYPATSEGSIAVDIDDTSLAEFDLTPAGVGASYEAEGYATIGKEAVRYTISGDTVTLTERGAQLTTPDSHKEGDEFQQAKLLYRLSVPEAAEEILGSVENIEASDLDTAQWEDVASSVLGGFRVTRFIPSPMGVRKLLNSLCNLGLTFYDDDLSGKIKMMVLRPLDYDEEIEAIGDDTGILKGTLKREDLPDQVTTQVVVRHGVADWLEDLEKKQAYSRFFQNIDADLRSADELGQDRVKVIYQPWFGVAGSDSFARAIGTRYATRYGQQQQQISFTADIKDKDILELARVVEVTSRAITDDIGQPVPTLAQVISRTDIDPGHRVSVVMQTYQLDGRWSYIMENTSTADYDSATDAEKEKGCYMIDETDPDYPLFDDGTSAYQMF